MKKLQAKKLKKQFKESFIYIFIKWRKKMRPFQACPAGFSSKGFCWFVWASTARVCVVAFSWSSTASRLKFEQPFTKALSLSLPRFVWIFWPQQISQNIKPLLLSYFNQGLPSFHSSLNPLPLFFFLGLGFLEGGGSAGPVLADCSGADSSDCEACLLLTFSSSFSPSSFFFWLPFFHHHSFFSKIVWYPFCYSWFCFYSMQVGRLLNPTAITDSSSAHRLWRRVRMWLT